MEKIFFDKTTNFKDILKPNIQEYCYHVTSKDDWDFIINAIIDEDSYNDAYKRFWDEYKEDTCLYLNNIPNSDEIRIMFSDMKWPIENGWKIIELSSNPDYSVELL